LILDRIAPEKREAFLRSRAKLMDKGDAELLAIVLHLDTSLRSLTGSRSDSLRERRTLARDIDTARKEVQALTEAVRSARDGLNALTARCKVLDDAVAVFHGVARARLWWLIALAFLSGAAVGWATFFIKF
jgi:chromosome segregation ATPase